MSTRTVPDHLVAETYARQTIAMQGRNSWELVGRGWAATIDWADDLAADAEDQLAIWDAYHEGDRP